MEDEKGYVEIEEIKKLKVGLAYLKNEHFEKATQLFEQLIGVPSITPFVDMCLLLSKNKVVLEKVEDDIEFYEKMLDISAEKSDIECFEKAYDRINYFKNLERDDNEFVDTLIQKHENSNFLIKCYYPETMRAYISKFNETYNYCDLLISVAQSLILCESFSEATEYLLEAKTYDYYNFNIAKLLLLAKTGSFMVEDLIKVKEPLDTLQEFDDLLVTCNDEEREHFMKILKSQQEYIVQNPIQKEEPIDENVEKVAKAIVSFIPGVAALILSSISMLIFKGVVGLTIVMILSFFASVFTSLATNDDEDSKWVLFFANCFNTLGLFLFMIFNYSDPVWGLGDGAVFWMWNYLDSAGWYFVLSPFIYIIVMAIFFGLCDWADYLDFGSSFKCTILGSIVGSVILFIFSLIIWLILNFVLSFIISDVTLVSVILRGLVLMIFNGVVVTLREKIMDFLDDFLF